MNYTPLQTAAKRSIFLLILAAALAFSIRGQDEDSVRIETNLVNINVAVTDGRGNHVDGLKRENFEIFDNKTRQTITHFSAEDAPVSFGIIYDMHPTTPERTAMVLESLQKFVKGLGEKDDFFTVVFNKRGSLILDFVPTSEQIETQLGDRYREPNALYDAIYLAAEKIRRRPNLKRVLLVITDSADHNSEHSFSDILERMKTLDAQVYAVLWDQTEKWEYADVTKNGRPRPLLSGDADRLDRASLGELTKKTGGDLRTPATDDAGELLRIYDQIASEMRRQYALGFYPPAVGDGRWHDLKIKLTSVKKGRKIVLNYRRGYQSPKSEQ
ncbi:MAG: VWA domain-containing protein [Pyrinomonadaceae bacterium]